MTFFTTLQSFEDTLWGYVGFPVLMLLGLYLSWLSGFVQIRRFPAVCRTFFGFFTIKGHSDNGVHPLKVFFACVGGCVGVGNIVGVCTAVQIGGPGALFWLWVTAVLGSMVKYSEVYLGVRYRFKNELGGYNGGPMYFLKKVFKTKWIPSIICLLLCVYGVEIYQFSVVTSSITTNFGINQSLVSIVLLGLVMFASSGGVQRVGSISSAIIPFFVVLYVSMSGWVLSQHYEELPTIMRIVFSSAFSGHAAMGGFFGSTLMMAISRGVRQGCYTGDLGIGYASVIHAESSAKIPEQQASLVIIDIFLDTFVICTSSILVILVSDVWHQPVEASLLVQNALAQHFPYMHIFMPLFLFLLGYSTINAYFCVGLKCAAFLSPKYGRMIYYVYAAAALFACSFVNTVQAQSVMQIAAGMLLVLNCYGIYKLRHELSFDLDAQEAPSESSVMILDSPSHTDCGISAPSTCTTSAPVSAP